MKANLSRCSCRQETYEQFLTENGLEYNRLNLQPIWDNDSEYDYVMWGNWPIGEMQYKVGRIHE